MIIRADRLVDFDQRTAANAPRKSLRVLHVINGEHYSGAERVQDLLACELPRFGYEAGFACLKPGAFAATRRRIAPDDAVAFPPATSSLSTPA